MTEKIRDEKLKSRIKQLEKENSNLQQSLKQYQDIVDNATVGSYIIQDGIIVFANYFLGQLFGYSISEMKGKLKVEDIIHPNDLPMALENIKKRESGTYIAHEVEYRFIRKDNSEFWGEIFSFPSFFEGKPSITGTLIDITFRKKNEKITEKIKKKFEKIFFDSPIGIAILDLNDGTYLDINHSFEKITGLLKENIIGIKGALGAMSLDKEKKEKTINHLKLNNKIENWEFDIIKKDGKQCKVLTSISAFKEDDQRLAIMNITDITDYKHSKIRYQSLFEGSRDGIVFINEEGIILECNESYAHIIGYSVDEITGTSFWDITPKEYHDWEKQEIIKKQLLIKGYSDVYEKEYIHKNGNFVPVELQAYYLKSQDGKSLFWAVVRDITEKKAFINKLQEQKSLFRTVVDYTYDWEYWISPEHKFNYISPSVFRITGYKVENFIEDHELFIKIIHPKDKSKFLKHLRNHKKKGVEQFRFRIIHKNGEVRWIDHACQVMINEDGNFIGNRSSNRDISDLVKTEEERKKIEGHFKLAQRIGKIGSWSFDYKRNQLFWSDEVFRILDFDQDLSEATNEKFISRIHPYERDFVSFVYQNSLETKESYDIIYRLLLNDGKIKYVRERCDTEFDDDGSPFHSQGTIQDITDQKNAEKKVMMSDARFKAVYEQAPIGIAIIESETGRFLSVNKYYCDILGYTVEEMQKSTFQQITHPDDLQEDLDNMKLLINEEIKDFKMEKRYFSKSGKIIYVKLSVVAMWNELDEKKVHLAIVEDITDVKLNAEKERLHKEQLQQADKLASLGHLVTGVAHEINNPNNFIMLNTSLLSNSWNDILPVLDKYHEIHQDFEIAGIPYDSMKNRIPKLYDGVVEGSKRIKNIVTDLKDFARKDYNSYDEKVNINEVVNSAISLLKNYIKKSTVNFNIELYNRKICVKGNKQKLEQVIINLIQNACDALENKNDAIKISTNVIRDKCIISINDNGCGIEANDLKHIFDPFYTKKLNGIGTGLGLSVSNGIVKEHGGTLEFHSEVGVGTDVNMIIPIVECKDKKND